MGVTISRMLIDRIRAEAAADPSVEICGLLLGEGDRIQEAVPARNVASDPCRQFEIDPQVLFAAIRGERAGGRAIMGYYHSHPSGSACPSARDTADAAGDAKVWMIVAGDGVTAWRTTSRGFETLPLVPIDQELA